MLHAVVFGHWFGETGLGFGSGLRWLHNPCGKDPGGPFSQHSKHTTMGSYEPGAPKAVTSSGGRGWELAQSHELEAETAHFSAHWCPAALVASRGPRHVPAILGWGKGHGPHPETWGETKLRPYTGTHLGFRKHKDLSLPLDATHPGQDQGNEMETVTHATSPAHAWAQTSGTKTSGRISPSGKFC